MDSDTRGNGSTIRTDASWAYEPAADLGKGLSDRLTGFPREPHLWMFVIRSIFALLLRAWLRLYHRLEVRGAEHLPIGRSFVMVANHQSHLDAVTLVSVLPLKWIHRAFPAAASDYFFSNLPTSTFSAVIINALPFDRRGGGEESLAVCRALLEQPGNILVIFPEGTRSLTGELGRFRSGVGRMVAGTGIPVVPCHLAGAHRALPKGSRLPRPSKLVLTLGPPRGYGDLQPSRETVESIGSDLRRAVLDLECPP